MPDRNPLPYIEIKGFKGLNTKSVPTSLPGEVLRTCSNVDFVRKYGGLAKSKGTSRVLSTQYKEGGNNKPISWVGFYKFPDLDGQILRRVIIQAGTTIQLVNTATGGLTSLATGRTSGLFSVSAQLDSNLFFSNQNDLLVGNGDGMFKYDGHEVTLWGVRKPGDDSTNVDTFDSVSGWTATNATIIAEATTTFDGDSIKMTQGGSTTSATMLKALTSTFNGQSGESDRVRVFVYIDPTSFDNLATSGASLQVWASSDNGSIATNFYRFDFSIGLLLPGWNNLALDFSSAPSGSNGTSGGTLDTTAIKTVQFGLIAQTASDAVVVYWDKLDTLELGAPTGTLTDTSGSVFTNNAINGIYKYRVTYVSKYGLESNAGPALTVDNRGGSDTFGSIELAGIPTSPDSQIIARRVYRTIGNGGIFLLLTQLQDNTTTTFSDTVSDGALGTDTPPILGRTLVGKDTERPPDAGIIAVWKKTVFLAGDPLNPATLFFSQDAKGEAFPFRNTFDFPERITGLFKSNFGLVVCTETSFWRVTGDNPNFDVERVLDGMGSVARRGVGTTRTLGWATDLDGMRTFDLVNQSKISEPIRDKYDALDRTKIDTLHTGHTRKDNAIIQFNPDSSGDFDSAFVYQYWIDDPTVGFWQTLDLPSEFDIMHLQEIEDANGDPKLYAADRDGMLFELFDDDAKDWILPNGNAQAIVTTFSTVSMRLGEAGRQIAGWAGRVQPRFIEIQTEGDSTIWTVLVEMFKGPDSTTAMDSATYTFEVGPKRSLQRLPAKALHPSEYIKVTVTNNDSTVASVIEAIRVYFFTKPGQFMVDTAEDQGGNV